MAEEKSLSEEVLPSHRSQTSPSPSMEALAAEAERCYEQLAAKGGPQAALNGDANVSIAKAPKQSS